MNLLNQRCKIERSTTTKNAQKQTVKTWSVINSEAKCNIQYNTISQNRTNQTDSGQTIKGEFLGFFDTSENLVKGDRITWGDLILFVEGVPLPVYAATNAIHHKEIFLTIEET